LAIATVVFAASAASTLARLCSPSAVRGGWTPDTRPRLPGWAGHHARSATVIATHARGRRPAHQANLLSIVNGGLR
jgi:hypothetical protein